MKTHGHITGFPEISKQEWNQIIADLALNSVTTAEITNPMTGDKVEIQSPPNQIAEFQPVNGNGGGVIRLCVFGDDIDFEGTGEEFQKIIDNVCSRLMATIDYF